MSEVKTLTISGSSSGNNGQYVRAEDYAALKAERDALAALTAQPVKLPKKEKALIGRDYLYVYCAGPVESAIRAAGYQVEGE